jgi:hypothetical protein
MTADRLIWYEPVIGSATGCNPMRYNGLDTMRRRREGPGLPVITAPSPARPITTPAERRERGRVPESAPGASDRTAGELGASGPAGSRPAGGADGRPGAPVADAAGGPTVGTAQRAAALVARLGDGDRADALRVLAGWPELAPKLRRAGFTLLDSATPKRPAPDGAMGGRS